MSEHWRETYDQWKLATPPEHEGEDDAWDQYEEDGPMDIEDQLERELDRCTVGKTEQSTGETE